MDMPQESSINGPTQAVYFFLFGMHFVNHPMSYLLGVLSPGQMQILLVSRKKIKNREPSFPTCQVRVVRFYVGGAAPPSSFLLFPSSFFLLLLPPSSSPDLICQLLIALICQLLIAMVLAGHHLPALNRSEPRRMSSASS